MMKFKTFFNLLFFCIVFSPPTLSAFAAEATFSWIPNDPEPSGYKIYFGIESRIYTQVIDVDSPVIDAGRIIQTVAGLEEGQTYYFAATAYSETEESAYTDEIVHTIPVTTVSTDTGEATFSWIPNDPEPDGYKIYYGNESGNYTEVVDVVTPVTADGRIIETVTGLEEGQTYYFAATAYSGTEESAYTEEIVYIVPVATASDSPVVSDISFQGEEDSVLSGQLTVSDIESDNLTYTLVSQAANGTVTISSSGFFTYTPDEGYSGSDSFTFNVTDGGIESATVIVNITINDVQAELAFEMGELQVTSDWQHVEFTTTFINPSVVAKSTTAKDSESGVVAIRNVSSAGFDIRIQEWDYLDGTHPEEKVSFLAMERGHHQVADGVYAVADCSTITGLNNYTSISYSNPLSTHPVVLSSVVTKNDADAVTLRIKNVDSNGFSVFMQEQEDNDGVHREETMCFIAWETMSGIVDDLMVEVAVTDMTLTHVPETVSFTQPFTELPLVMAGMQTASGGDTAVVGLSDVSVTDAAITIVEEQSADSEIGHIQEVGGYFAIAPFNPDDNSYPSAGFELETGEVQVNHETVRVNFQKSFLRPVVIANMVTRKGNNPCVVRISDVTEDGFNIQLQEYGYLDNSHVLETVSYIVMEEGSHTLDDGTRIEAGLFTSNATATSESVYFAEEFTTAPVVLTSTNSMNDVETVTGRVQNITTEEFQFRLQEQEANAKDHGLETIAYIAWTPGAGEANGIRYEAGKTTDSVTHDFYNVAFLKSFDELPYHFADMQTTDGTDPSTLSIIQSGLTDMDIFVEEECSKDSEISHTTEVAGYLVISPQM